jgi:hypothetical protein
MQQIRNLIINKESRSMCDSLICKPKLVGDEGLEPPTLSV